MQDYWPQNEHIKLSFSGLLLLVIYHGCMCSFIGVKIFF